MPLTGVEAEIPTSERPQTQAVDRTATVIDQLYFNCATSEQIGIRLSLLYWVIIQIVPKA